MFVIFMDVERIKNNGKPSELILGHRPGMEEEQSGIKLDLNHSSLKPL